MKKIIILVMTIIVVLPSIVLSECAWVLWTKTETLYFKEMKDDLSPEHKVWWELKAAVPTYNQCLDISGRIWKKQKEYYKQLDKFPGIEKVEGESGIIIKTLKDNKGSISESYYCLPETLDPTHFKQ